MFCSRCGKLNANDAVYCQKCGVLLEPEDETRVAPRTGLVPQPDDNEHNIFSISPTLLFVKAGYVAAAFVAILMVALLKLLLPGVSVWLAVLTGMLLLLVPAYFHVRQKLVRYTLTESKIEIDSGLVSRVTRNVPLDRIQDVTVSTSVGQRLLGLGDLIIDNANEAGGTVILKNIDSPKKRADVLLRHMHRKHSVLPPSTSKL
jgi:uncharacterized membrane protein YdbT with pleckstrin-like domain